MIKAILFDFNATLICAPEWMALETRTLPQDAFRLLASQGHVDPLSRKQLLKADETFQLARKTANLTNRETSHVVDLIAVIDALGYQQAVSHFLAEETVTILQRRCVPNVSLMADVETTLKRLLATGFQLGIISNAAYSPFLIWTLEHFRVLSLFEEVVVSADVGIRKPSLEIFRTTLDSMRINPSQAIYVGDDFHKDVVPAKQLGLRAVWYRPTGDTSIPKGEATPDAIIVSHSEIPALAEQWLSP